MAISVIREHPGGDDTVAADAVRISDDDGDEMIVSSQSFAEFVGRVKAGEFDQHFDPATGRFQ